MRFFAALRIIVWTLPSYKRLHNEPEWGLISHSNKDGGSTMKNIKVLGIMFFNYMEQMQKERGL